MNLRRAGSIHGRDLCGTVRHRDLRDQIGPPLIWHTLAPAAPVRPERLAHPAPIGLAGEWV